MMPSTPASNGRWLVIPALILGLGLGVLTGRAWTKTEVSPQRIGVNASGTVIGIGQSPPFGVASDVEFRMFWDVWNLLKQKYYQQPIEDKRLFYGALAGLAYSLDDPYTTFFEPSSAQEFEQALSGKFEGIGAEIGLREGRITVIAPLPGTPAERAGLRPGDLINTIDGEETTGFAVEEAVTKIRGPKGTQVTLGIERPDAQEPLFEVTITRDQIQVESVRVKQREDGIAMIEVTNFNGDTEAGFSRAVQQVLRAEPKGLIIDLRNNPGGYLDTALAMAGEWVGDAVVVKERRHGEIFEELRGLGRKRLSGIPTVVLVNEGSASAAEIVAGALQDYGVATIVGAKTFGKGSVQDYVDLPDGSAVKITIAEWLTPKERTINKTGLEPDVAVDRTPEDYEKQLDPQLDRAVAILNGTAPASDAATSTQSE